MTCRPIIDRLIPTFHGFTAFQPNLPEMYWNVKSQEQRIFTICEVLHKLTCYVDMLGDEANDMKALLNELNEQFEQFKEHGFDDYYAAQIETWIENNLETIMNDLVRQVFFGLTLDGYFKAIVPESWHDIMFDTGMTYGLDTYGRLMLRMDVDSPHMIDQTPEVVEGY